MYKKNTAFNYEPIRFSKPSKKENKSKDPKKDMKTMIEERVENYENNYLNSPSLIEKRIHKVSMNLNRINTKINYLLLSNDKNNYFIETTARARKSLLEVELFRLESRLDFLTKNPDLIPFLNSTKK